MRKVIIMGAGGRDFHDFNVSSGTTRTKWSRSPRPRFPGSTTGATRASLAGPLYPKGIPILPEAELPSPSIARGR